MRAEELAAGGSVGAVFRELRQLCLDDFGEFMLSLPDPAYPKLSHLLPAMASADVQRNWTGGDGYSLLRQSLAFVRSVSYNYMVHTGRQLDEGSKILDFGCGYGRIARLMYYFTDPVNLYCVDPWDESIRLCRESRLLGNLFISEYLPRTLPFSEARMDLIYCFSVFTHLSRRACGMALSTLRDYISPKGLLVITIRPEEYWLSAKIDPELKLTANALLREHNQAGFAFAPHRREPIDGDVTYGDTSMTVGWISKEFPRWRIVGSDRSLEDPFQILVFLVPNMDAS